MSRAGSSGALREIPFPTCARWFQQGAGSTDKTIAVDVGYVINNGQMLKKLDDGTKIYRYMAAEHLLNYLGSGTFRLSSISQWEDPYEKWWHSRVFRAGSSLSEMQAFGSCWTTRARSEPFWRLYESNCSHKDSDGKPLPRGYPPVRIGTTVGNLREAFISALAHRNAHVFLARVGYATTKALKIYSDSLAAYPAQIPREVAHSLTFKRQTFSFEREIRLLWIDRECPDTSRSVNLPHGRLIDSILIGPVARSEQGQRGISELKKKIKELGYKRKLQHSLIYDLPKNEKK